LVNQEQVLEERKMERGREKVIARRVLPVNKIPQIVRIRDGRAGRFQLSE